MNNKTADKHSVNNDVVYSLKQADNGQSSSLIMSRFLSWRTTSQ